MRSHILFVLLFSCLTLSSLGANTLLLERSWQSPYGIMQGSLAVQVPQIQQGPNGQPQTVYVTRWVQVRVRLRTAAPLRKGEWERFRVTAQALGTGHAPTIHLNLRPEWAYHAYRSEFCTALGSWADMDLFHDGRIRNRPPASFDEMKVQFETPADPVVLSFRDFALDENGEAATSYGFRVLRRVWFGKDKLVARGEVEGNSVVLTQDSPHAAAGEEWFKEGKGYKVLLKLRRTGSEVYTEDWSSEASATFTWEKDAPLHREAPATARSTDREEKFEQVHGR